MFTRSLSEHQTVSPQVGGISQLEEVYTRVIVGKIRAARCNCAGEDSVLHKSCAQRQHQGKCTVGVDVRRCKMYTYIATNRCSTGSWADIVAAVVMVHGPHAPLMTPADFS